LDKKPYICSNRKRISYSILLYKQQHYFIPLMGTQETKGFYKLSWMQRIGFGSGDLAQNLIYQTISMYLLIFYTNVFGLQPGTAAFMFLIVRLIDVLWDPVVGTFIDKHNPRWGKYRSYLLLAGIPLSAFAILCFWNGFSGSLFYAYFTYVGMSMLYTLINVPYGALNSSLTRDTNEITILTSVRMVMANIGGLIVSMGIPYLVGHLSPDGKMNSSLSGDAWFTTMAIYGVAGFLLLVFCFTQTKERVVMDQKEAANVKVSDLWKEFGRNRPLRVLAFFFIATFTISSVGNAAGSYFMIYNIHGTADQVSVFMGLSAIAPIIFLPFIPVFKRWVGKKNMFYMFLTIALIGLAMLYAAGTIPGLKQQMWFVYLAQFVRSVGTMVTGGYMWALIPEVVSYSEYTTGRRIAGIVNALTGIFFKAGMALGGVIPGAVLALVHFDKDNAVSQTPLAEQGILWLIAVIPAILVIASIFIIRQYELTDEVIDKINREIEERNNN